MWKKKSLRYSLDDDAVFCSAVLSSKEKFAMHYMAVEAFFEEWWQWEALVSLGRRRHGDRRNAGEGPLEVCFCTCPSKNRKKKHAMFTGSRRRMNTLVNSVDPSHRRFVVFERSLCVIRDVLAFLQTSERRPLCTGKSYYEPISTFWIWWT